MADAPAPAVPLLIEALIFLGALGFDVMMIPDAGIWFLMVGEEVVTVSEVVEKAIALGMVRHRTVR